MTGKMLVFLGSERVSGPPRPARLGERVSAACMTRLAGKDVDAALIDPVDIDLPHPFKPHFAYSKGKAPEAMERLAEEIESADGYVMVSPEYNHMMSPALSDLLNHFGSSLFSYKPSAIVTYSAGQWGGTRAAVGMRTFLSELGCLPVSAMIHVPHAQDVFAEDGGYLDGVDGERWDGYLDRTFDQLCWWAKAAAHARHEDGARPGAFIINPSERDAPKS
ncbi:NAD(P)H-dependent oxidoreductase [Sphingobium limneticum]|jgi:chromate reductase|uniref:NAD(P)H-dependent oxidoreductase n=3 Tax=Sphingobium limneticum TaxID=1007511 RepID=A0A5J5HSF9_9SPHN|nr:NAD(P)H-dependent oxidoreductase [Sphingobium limneticum]KAA9025418.1 NAD(P)H-dependent oxidoreductase [Sphingobium limneticum]